MRVSSRGAALYRPSMTEGRGPDRGGDSDAAKTEARGPGAGEGCTAGAGRQSNHPVSRPRDASGGAGVAGEKAAKQRG